jgi:hypothetical protein
MKRVVGVIVLGLLLGCSKKPAEKVPTCAEVTENMLKIVQAQYPGHGDMGGMGNRQAVVQQCEARNMPAAEKRCIVKAKTTEDLGECRRASMPKQPEGSGSAPPK